MIHFVEGFVFQQEGAFGGQKSMYGEMKVDEIIATWKDVLPFYVHRYPLLL